MNDRTTVAPQRLSARAKKIEAEILATKNLGVFERIVAVEQLALKTAHLIYDMALELESEHVA